MQDVFRQAVGLESLTRGLAADVSAAGGERLQPLLARLSRVAADLDAAARAITGAPAASRAMRPLAEGPGDGLDPSALSASERGRIAFTNVLRTPREVSRFLQAVAQARVRLALKRSTTRVLRQRGRHLLRGTRVLKRSLASLRGASG